MDFYITGWAVKDAKSKAPQGFSGLCGALQDLLLAERVGFEPTYRLITDNSISSRARYDHFATFPRSKGLYRGFAGKRQAGR